MEGIDGEEEEQESWGYAMATIGDRV